MNKTHQLLLEHSQGNQNYFYWYKNKGNYSKLFAGAAASGSILHQLLLKGQLDIHEFSSGFAFIKLHALVMRSKGIKNRIRTYCQNWENLAGIAHDNFCCVTLESLWDKLLLILAQKGVYKNLLLELAVPSKNFNYSLSQVKAALVFLHDFWQACAKTIYRKQTKRLLNTKALLELV